MFLAARAPAALGVERAAVSSVRRARALRKDLEREAGLGRIEACVRLHSAGNRGKSEPPLDRSGSAFPQGPSAPLQFIGTAHTSPAASAATLPYLLL